MEKYEPGMKEELPARLVEAGTYTDGKKMAFLCPTFQLGVFLLQQLECIIQVVRRGN